MDRIRKIFLWGNYLLSFLMPFIRHFEFVIVFVILTGLLLFDYKKTTNYKKQLSVFVLFGLYFFVQFISVFYSDNQYLKEMEPQLSFLFLPVIFINDAINRESRIKILLLFVLGNFVASIICWLKIIYDYTVFGSEIFDVNINFWYYLYNHFSVFMHTTYFALYLLFGIGILYFYRNEILETSYLTKKILTFLMVFFFLMILVLSSRVGIISSVIFLIYILHKAIKSVSISIKIAAFVLVFIAAGVVLSSNYHFRKIIKQAQSDDFKTSLMQVKRFQIWKSSIKVIHENFVFGVGMGDVETELGKHSESLKDNVSLNAHNQFLQSFVAQGFIGFVLLVAIFLFLYHQGVKNRNILLIFLLLSMLLFMQFESMLGRLQGVIFFCYFSQLLLMHDS